MGKVVEKGQATAIKRERMTKTKMDQRKDLQRSVSTQLHTHCQIESFLDKLIHPRVNLLTGSNKQTFKMPLK